MPLAVRLLFRPYSWAIKGESDSHTARFCRIPADPVECPPTAAAPDDVQKILAYADHQRCDDCAAAPSEPCTRPGRGRTVHKSRLGYSLNRSGMGSCRWSSPFSTAGSLRDVPGSADGPSPSRAALAAVLGGEQVLEADRIVGAASSSTR